MRKFIASILLLCASTLRAQMGPVPGSGGGAVGSGTALTACTSSILYADASSLLKCNPASVVNGSVSTAGRSILTIKDTITGASATSNFLNLTGAFNATLSAATSAIYSTVAFDDDNQQQAVIRAVATGLGPAAQISAAVWGDNSSTASQGATGGYFTANTTSPTNIGVWGQGSGGTRNVGGYFTLGVQSLPGSSGALIVDNMAVAAPIFEARDNGTAVFTIADGGNITLGTSNTISDANGRSFTAVGLFAQNGNALALGNNGVATAYVPAATLAWTAATMNLTVPQYRTQTTQCAWTNAMVVALGASLTGDITCATLQAKTRVESALLVIDTAAGGVTTLTVSCGDAIGGTPFTNYIVASDAKAAANTVYGDLISGAETGTSLFDATTKWRQNYIPSYTATTLVTCHFISTGTNLNTVTTSTGRLILTTTLLP